MDREEKTDLDPLEIDSHRGHEDRDLKERVDENGHGGIDRKVPHCRLFKKKRISKRI